MWRNTSLAAILLISLCGCVSEVSVSPGETNGSSGTYLTTDSENRLFVGTDAMLIPLAATETPFSSKLKTEGVYSYSLYGRNNLPNFDAHDGYNWVNAIVFDKSTGKSHLLLNRAACLPRILCRKIDPNNPKAGAHYQLMVLIDTDTSGDNKLTAADASAVYFADLPNDKLVQLTPANTQIKAIVQDPAGEMLYFRLLEDSNGDHTFDSHDRERWYRSDPTKPAMANRYGQTICPHKRKSWSP